MARVFMKGTEAIAEAAVRAGCRFFAGYPITPQNEIPEYLARRLPEVREMLLRHRRMMNRPGGYWIAGFAPEAARHGTHRVYRREELSRVVLFSDGFSGQREALLGAEEPCLQELYRQLRQRGAADSRCNRYPRLKPGDDVSGIVAVF